MKLTGSRADKFLSSPTPSTCGVLLFGPDRGFVKQRSEALAALYVADVNDAFSTTVLTADDVQSDPAKLEDEMVSLSLLGDSRLVRVRLDHERSGAAISKLIKSLDLTPDRCEAKLIVEAGDLTPRSAVRKVFEAAKNFAAIGCYPANLSDVSNLIRSGLNTHSISIEPEALQVWAPLLQGDRGLLTGEIEKMALYKGYGSVPNAVVTLEDIQKVAAGGQVGTIDDIIMGALSGNPSTCDKSFRIAMSGKVNAAVILRSLQRHLTRLLEARAHVDMGENAESAMRALRPPVFRMQERSFATQLRMWPQTRLQQALSQTMEAEMALKTAGAPVEAITSRILLALASYAKRLR